jgi:hypothetical protein
METKQELEQWLDRLEAKWTKGNWRPSRNIEAGQTDEGAKEKKIQALEQ